MKQVPLIFWCPLITISFDSFVCILSACLTVPMNTYLITDILSTLEEVLSEEVVSGVILYWISCCSGLTIACMWTIFTSSASCALYYEVVMMFTLLMFDFLNALKTFSTTVFLDKVIIASLYIFVYFVLSRITIFIKLDIYKKLFSRQWLFYISFTAVHSTKWLN